MKKELTDTLYQLCPNLYYNHENDLYGIGVGDGWYGLIKRLSLELENLILSEPEQERKNYRAVQIKEKFGSLRFYLLLETQKMRQVILQAEVESSHICEVCGQAGQKSDSAWTKVRCTLHQIKL